MFKTKTGGVELMNENFRLIYEPSDRKMRVVVLFSGGASAVSFMNDGKKYEIVGAISSNKAAPGIKRLKNMGVPVEILDIHDFYGARPIKDMGVRELFDEKLVSIIKENAWSPDIIACAGYMYVLTAKFLNEFPNKVLNVHPADLNIRENGKRRYTGANVVKDQIAAGERVTKSSIHIMAEKVDDGPILCVSCGLLVENRAPNEQQELMKKKCDGPAYGKTLELLAEGRLAIDGENNIYLKRDNRWESGEFRMD
jgi:phosphoribosylglycinamide formyltransferase 1